MKKILLNVCCAPDATHSIDALRGDGYEPQTWFYNPNIHPRDEYHKRVADMNRLAAAVTVDNIPDVPYEMEEWFRRCKHLAAEPERGRRCEECFRMRMDKTAQKAKETGHTHFATTLTISPHKDAKLINRLGKEAAEKYGVGYLETDFKKKDGFKKSIELSRKYGLYRQDYCGCAYSLREKIRRSKAKAEPVETRDKRQK